MTPDTTDILKRSYRLSLFPVALAAIEAGRLTEAELRIRLRTEADRSHAARLVANYAATDLILSGKTVWFTAEEVGEVLEEFAPKSRRAA